MLVQQLQTALFAILSLTVGGYAPWAPADAVPRDMFDATLEPLRSAVAAPLLPTSTVEPETNGGRATWEGTDPAPSPVVPVPGDTAPEFPWDAEAAPLEASASGVATQNGVSSLGYRLETVEYLTEIGLGAEFGDSELALRKWTQDLRVQIHGAPSSEDIKTLHQVVDELDELVAGLDIRLTGGDGNVDVHFLPEEQFASVEPQYVPRNLGFFRVWWDGAGDITRARILIASRTITQQERSHLIREELTQSLGLLKDSWEYPDSIFYQGWTDTVQFTELDRAAIRLLYDPRLRPGMARSEVLEALGAPTLID